MIKKYCGYISIVGKPNVGKSTLINSILGKKISITSRKSQTTRNNLLGVKTDDEHQMIFIDTPGIGGYDNPVKIPEKTTNWIEVKDMFLIFIGFDLGIVVKIWPQQFHQF